MKMGWIRPRLPPWALEDVNDLEQVRRYAMYMTSGKPGAFEEDDEGEILGFSTSSVPICVMPDIWADQDEKESVSDPNPDWQAGLPASLRTYRAPRPRPYMRPAAEPLPGHAESYNPPPEFLLDPEEVRVFLYFLFASVFLPVSLPLIIFCQTYFRIFPLFLSNLLTFVVIYVTIFSIHRWPSRIFVSSSKQFLKY